MHRLQTRSAPHLRRPGRLALTFLAALAAGCGSPAASSGPDLNHVTAASLNALDQQAHAWVRAQTRAALGADADPAFAAIDADFASLLSQASQAATGAAPSAPPRRRALVIDGGLGMGLLIAFLDKGIQSGTFPFSSQTVTDAGTFDAQIQTSFSTSGSKVVGQVVLKDTFTSKSGQVAVDTVTGSLEADFCPDEQGVVTLRYTLHWGMDFPGSGGGAQIDVSGTAHGVVGDDASLLYWTTASDFGGAVQTGATATSPATSAYLQEHNELVIQKGATITAGVVKSDLVRASDLQTPALAQLVKDYQTRLPLLYEIMGFQKAEDQWQGGYCVEIQLDGVTDSNDVDTSSITPFTGRVHHKIENADLPLPIAAALSGAKQLAPTARSTAPVSYTYEAPDTEGTTATAALETRSRRGVGKKSVAFKTRAVTRYAGTIDFSGSTSGSSSSSTFTGTVVLELARTRDDSGGSTFSIDLGKTTVTFLTFHTVSGDKTCDLIDATASASLVGELIVAKPIKSYTFGFGATVTGQGRCVTPGGATTEPMGGGTVLGTGAAPGDVGFQPLGLGKRLSGSVRYVASGFAQDVDWVLTAR